MFEALLHAFLPVYLVYFSSLDQCTGQVLDPDSALRPIAPPVVHLLTYLRQETNNVHQQTGLPSSLESLCLV